MTGLVILTVIIAVITAAVTLVWWKVGDQWADDEYKKFGHGGGAPKGPPPKVIKDFNPISGAEPSDPQADHEQQPAQQSAQEPSEQRAR